MSIFSFFSKNYLIYAFVFLSLSSCKKDDEQKSQDLKGTFVVSQGQFPAGASSVTFIPKEAGISEVRDLFSSVNGTPLGSVAQDLLFDGNTAYISVANFREIVRLNSTDFKVERRFQEVQQPRYFTKTSDGRILVSAWGEDGFSGGIFLLNPNSVTTLIQTGRAPEQMLVSGRTLYVTMSNGFARDSFLRAYDLENNQIIQEWVVGIGPNSIRQTSDGSIWVLCGGAYDFTTQSFLNGSLWHVKNNVIVDRRDLGPNPSNLEISADERFLYFLGNSGVSRLDISQKTIGAIQDPYISGSFYGLGIHPVSGDIWVTDPKDFASQGEVLRYSASGTFIAKHSTGNVPARIVFRD